MSLIKGIGVGIAVLTLIVWLISDDGPIHPFRPAHYVPKATREENKCNSDLRCSAEQSIHYAGVWCERPIEHQAQYTMRWTGPRYQRFDRFRWLDQSTGQITFIGDRAEFQNGFGAYQPVIYECDFDPTAKQVLAARVRAGRLP